MLSIQNVSFAYQKDEILKNITFKVKKAQNIAIIGESGCGKSTLLKLIYGLYDLNNGSIFWNDFEILGPKYNLIPGMDFMKYLSQDFDLMPYITVAENVGKYLSNIYPEIKQNRINELLEVVEMSEFANQKAKNLSGGQMQRVAIARVLALEPQVLLLDEPFSHIDNFRKNTLRRKLFAYLKSKQITTIVATHDSTDVLSFADYVCVLQNGKIVEYNTPVAVYKKATNYYTASLFGDVNKIIINKKEQLVYPNQLKIVAQSSIKVNITQSYYRGSYYLIECNYGEQTLFFENNEALKNNLQICLAIL